MKSIGRLDERNESRQANASIFQSDHVRWYHLLPRVQTCVDQKAVKVIQDPLP